MIYRFANYALDARLYELRRDGAPHPVEPQVFDVLRYLVEHRDRVVTREELSDAVWADRFVSDTTISSRIKAARRAVGDNGRDQRMIQTVHGRGFRFILDVEEHDARLEPATSSSPLVGERIVSSSADRAPAAALASTPLVEREEALTTLLGALDRAGQSRGGIVLVAGEAGIGKSSLIESFREHTPAANMKIGSCDALTTPRPLGPLYDIARQGSAALSAVLQSDPDWHVALGGILEDLQTTEGPTVLVFEDVHWADEATVDLMISLARRISPLPALMVVTYRSDEVSTNHPLRRFLGSLPARDLTRIDLETLSTSAIRELAGAGAAEAQHLHALTGGNAFFLTEVLANPEGELPPTVRDAVLGRLARLSSPAREIAELISVVPGRFAIETLIALRPGKEMEIEEMLSCGTIRAAGDTLHFRHELARISVYESLPPIRKLLLHRQLLDHLLQGQEADADLAAIVHHGAALSDRSIISRYAPMAARKASATGAHREAFEYYRQALENERACTEPELASILEGISFETYLTGDTNEAIRYQERALELRRKSGQSLEAGSCLRWLSRLHWFAGRNEEARHYAAQAVASLETLPPSRELAMAYSNRSQLAMLESRLDSVIRWGARAIDLANELDDREVLAHAKTNVGLARMVAADPGGPPILEEALAICLEEAFHEHAVRVYVGLGAGWIAIRNYERAFHYIAEGIEYSERNDLDTWSPYLEAYLGRAELETGRWDEAERRLTGLVERDDLPNITRIAALAPLGRLQARRGAPDSRETLEQAYRLAEPIGELQRLGPTVDAMSEGAWLRGSMDEVRQRLVTTFNLAMKRDRVWIRESLAYWLWKAGATIDTTDFITPFGLQIAGEWNAAADRWKELGCPWERALSLGEGSPDAVREAIGIMEELGSTVGANAIRRDARARGIDVDN